MAELNLGDAFTPSEGTQGTAEAVPTPEVAEEKETPAETHTAEKPVEEATQVESPKQDADASELKTQLTGLQQEKVKLLEDPSEIYCKMRK